MQEQIGSPLFLVGCPRSGTTLLQSLLTTHPQITSFPESHFFSSVISGRIWLRKLGIASRRAKPRFLEFLGEIQHQEMQRYLPPFPLFVSQYVQTFIKVLNTLTYQQGKRLWLEKTPRHLHYITDIETFLPTAKFIHIVRNGTDVVASLYDVTHTYPEEWNGARDVDTCIRRWIEDVQISLSYARKPNHRIVRYEDLVEDTTSVLQELCDFIGVTFNDEMLSQHHVTARKVKLENEPWKLSAQEQIHNTASKKFYNVFDDNQRKYILERLSGINL